MADPTPGSDLEPPPRPRWLKVSGLIAIAVVLAVVLIMLFSGGEHGPGRHIPGGDNGSHEPPIEHAP